MADQTKKNTLGITGRIEQAGFESDVHEKDIVAPESDVFSVDTKELDKGNQSIEIDSAVAGSGEEVGNLGSESTAVIKDNASEVESILVESNSETDPELIKEENIEQHLYSNNDIDVGDSSSAKELLNSIL